MHVFIVLIKSPTCNRCVCLCLCVHAACLGATESAVWATAASWGWAQCVCCRSTTTRSPPWTRVPSTHCTPCPPCERTHTHSGTCNASTHTQNGQHEELHSLFFPPPATFWPIPSTVTVTWRGSAIGWEGNVLSLGTLAARIHIS